MTDRNQKAFPPRPLREVEARNAATDDRCGHSGCRQHWIDTGEGACVADAWAREYGCGDDCAGWRPGERGIEACDVCGRFPDDAAALAYVERAAGALALFRPVCAACGEALPETIEFGDRCGHCSAPYRGESG